MTVSTMTPDRQACFQLKTSFLPCTTLQLIRYDLELLDQQIKASIARAPMFFAGSPVVIDLEKAQTFGVLDFSTIKEILIANGMVPIGIRSGSEEQMDAARHAGLSLINLGKTTFEEPKKQIAADQPQSTTKLVTSPIRSGMQVFAKEGDLIVVAQVSPGAELLAVGNIHVYGALRGRALAGVNGNTQTRIFCQTLEAELVSIAGYYLTQEDMQALPSHDGIIQIYLENEQVKIGPCTGDLIKGSVT